MTLLERIRATGPKRILALDGGGIRGILTLEILAKIESLLREKSGGRDDFVLADYFDFIAGTSTGAIIGTALSLGMTVADIRSFYLDTGREMFEQASVLRRFRYKYEDTKLSQKLHEVFGAETTLGSDRLKTLIMAVMRNATTDWPWPVTCLLTLSGTFDQLFTYVMFAGWIFYALGAAGVFILRRKFPRSDRPYSVPGYPWVPILFVAVATWFVLNTLVNQTADSMVGLLLAGDGLPFYIYWKRTMLRSAHS